MKRIIWASMLMAGVVGIAFAALPPTLVNYQGVLRDASDRPLSGSYDMVFTFYSASTLGDQILIDSHTLASGGQVTVTGGLFNVQLGSGAVTDGSGPNTYWTLMDVFRDYGNVWLSIQVGVETLSPRVRIVSAAYALNATNATRATAALNADQLNWQPASFYLDTSDTAQTKTGALTCDATAVPSAIAVQGLGPTAGGYFKDTDQSGWALAGTGHYGIWAEANGVGGFFKDADNSGRAFVGMGNLGISAEGTGEGGAFRDTDSSGLAYVGYGDLGIDARGNTAGGYFKDSDSSGYAYVGSEEWGIDAAGTGGGGYFEDLDSSSQARVGHGPYGIEATGEVGGQFYPLDGTSEAKLGVTGFGIVTSGTEAGGYFNDDGDASSAYLAYSNDGIFAEGSDMGGNFRDIDSGVAAYVGYSTYKIFGFGTVSFVQNHPAEKDRVIVYAAPEGDEVAVYTRGTAQLADGEARVSLGPTFRWVTNPDIGLTVHLTPVGAWSDLYVASKGTEEIVVKSQGGDRNAVFDYIVYGLRIGFEESSIVQEKTTESYIPSMKDHRDLFARRPELRAYSALERFKSMQVGIGAAATDFSKSESLKAAIHEYDPATDPPVCKLLGSGPCRKERTSPPAEPAASSPPPIEPAGEVEAEAMRLPVLRGTVAVPGRSRDIATTTAEAPAGPLFPVSEPVEAGDLLALDPVHAGQFRKATAASDPAVVGIAAGPSQADGDGNLATPVANALYATVKVDAQFGVVRAGDLLVASATPGCAMKAPELIVAGTVIGKALEPLEVGTGRIKILVMPR